MSTLKKLLAVACLSLFGLVMGLVAVEIAYRLFMDRPSETWSDRPKFYFKAESSPTLQDFGHSPEKQPGTFRIAVVGDSYTFAPYMQFTDAFPKKLEQMLNLNAVPRRAEVINYGVPAYSTSHELPVVDRALDEQADLVILQITLNDPELKPYTPTGINLTLGDRFGEPQLGPTARKVFGVWRSLAYAYRRIHNTRSHQAYIDYFIDLFEHPRGWKKFSGAMKGIVERCKRRNVPIVAVVFPLFGIPMDESYPFYGIHDKVDRLLTELDAMHFDISEIYEGIPLERLQVLPGVDRHPNEIAHRMAAEAIYTWLEERGLIPQELMIRERFEGRTQLIKEKRLDPPALDRQS